MSLIIYKTAAYLCGWNLILESVQEGVPLIPCSLFADHDPMSLIIYKTAAYLCDWNLILESVQEGVPLIPWSLFAEQKMNAVMLVDGLKVG